MNGIGSSMCRERAPADTTDSRPRSGGNAEADSGVGDRGGEGGRRHRLIHVATGDRQRARAIQAICRCLRRGRFVRTTSLLNPHRRDAA